MVKPTEMVLTRCVVTVTILGPIYNTQNLLLGPNMQADDTPDKPD